MELNTFDLDHTLVDFTSVHDEMKEHEKAGGIVNA